MSTEKENIQDNTNNVVPYNAGNYDVIVVGAGHAGCEAALAAARMGNKTLLLTITLEMIAFMPCNPSIGGPAKGIIVREIDALGGEMAKNIDKSYIQMRMLNTSKGPAVRALRAQADKRQYSIYMKHTLENEPNLTLRQGMVDDLIIKDYAVTGVITSTGAQYKSKTVVLTTGTSARGKIIIGELMYSSGPNNSKPAMKLTKNLKDKYNFNIVRFKTGTPPRLNGKSIDYGEMEEQKGDKEANHFSFESSDDTYLSLENQLSCWLTYTNKTVHEIIYNNLNRAPMFTGVIEGVGPRYCPSIEDKVVRFNDKDRHQLFLEPEGRDTDEYYIDGLSTSLPEEVQLQIIHNIKGLKKAEMMRPGYAIEYDVVSPYQLKATLETKLIRGLYTAGQINGTSGYEEAAGQGLIAGINAGLKAKNKEEIVLKRSDAYIGVLIDDLVTKGTKEPYRMLTSRAEYRLILRHDNADLRLTDIGHRIGLISNKRYNLFLSKCNDIENEKQRLESFRINPSNDINRYLRNHGDHDLKDSILASDLLKRPYVSYNDLLKFIPSPSKKLDKYVIEQLEIQYKYEGYIKKANDKIKKLHHLESKKIPSNINYKNIDGLATEAVEKLSKIQPATLAQASRISGVNPSDISILAVCIKRGIYNKK